ncbi:transcriptional regulator, TetR family [bacterium A37T11]|nr:transcriptional regulator, TetR family [bacterium A37T11]
MDSSDKKKTKIIEAATLRFARFGMSKTTMAEIANDLSLSKALLYYYFPDKISLYAAVVEHIIQEMNDQLSLELPQKATPLEAINHMIDMRIRFISNYYNFFLHTSSPLKEIPEAVAKVIHRAQQTEIDLVRKILEKGNLEANLAVADPATTAALLVYALAGMRFSILKSSKEFFLPTKEEFNHIHQLQKQIAAIILKGLMREHKL